MDANIAWTGDTVEDMEIAKAVIAQHPNVDVVGLIAAASDRLAPHSARLASIYTLGFTDDQGLSRMALAAIRDDPGEDPDLRDHAEEALASIATN